jgi:hypothetical protein
MKISEKDPADLVKLVEQNLQFPNIWSIPSVSTYPEKRIKDWWIVSIVKSEVYGMDVGARLKLTTCADLKLTRRLAM